MKKIIFLFLIISTNLFSQNTIPTKDIADIALPNPEVELFYGHVAYSASSIIILPHHIIIYSPEKATFYLLNKENKLNLDHKSLFDIKHIVTRRINHGEDINGKFRTIKKYKTPYADYNFYNGLEMYTLSDTSAYGGIIRIKKDYKIVKLFVQDDRLKIKLIDYNLKKIYKPVNKKEKRRKIKLDKKTAINYSKYVEFGDKQFWLLGRSPYIYKKKISYNKNYIRDSVLNFNSLFYKRTKDSVLQLLYQNSFSDISKKGIPFKNGYWFSPQIFSSKDKLLLYLGGKLDSIIIFNQKLERVFESQLLTELKKVFPNKYDKKTNWRFYSIFKDEFTEKLYVIFPDKEGQSIAEILINEVTQELNFRFLRTYKSTGSWLQAISVNKGILYLKTKNSIVENDYIYQFDLYKNLNKKDSLLEIKFKNVNKQITKKDNWSRRSLLENEASLPLSKKLRKRYFRNIKKDTTAFPQNTYLEVLKSLQKAIEQDSISYALSYLMCYDAIQKLEMKDDIKSKNYLYFELLTEFYEKEVALNQIRNFVENFDSFDRQMYKNKMIVRTPNGFVFNLYVIDKQWYLSSVIKKITYKEED